MSSFPPEAYKKRNYKMITYDLSRTIDRIFVTGDWIDVYEYTPTTLDLSRIFLRLNNAEEIKATDLPVKSPFSELVIINRTGVTSGSITFIIGEEFFRREREGVEIVRDRSGIAAQTRWGRLVSPTWFYNSLTAPSAGATLVSVTPTREAYIYGFYISVDESNVFEIEWSSGGVTRRIRIVVPNPGTIMYTDFVALNEGLPAAPNTTISLRVVNAGSAGITYFGGLLVGW